MTHSSPSCTALVVMPPTSEPAPGSDMSWHHSVPAQDRHEVLTPLLVVHVTEQRAEDRPERAAETAGALVAEDLFVEDLLVAGGQALPAPLLRERDPGVAAVVQLGLQRA